MLAARLERTALPAGDGVAIRGEVDASNAPSFAEMLADACRGGADEVRVDLSHLELMDGSGVRGLLQVADGLRAQGRTLVLIAPGYIVRRALSVLTSEELLATIRITEE